MSGDLLDMADDLSVVFAGLVSVDVDFDYLVR